jgi:polyhydroxyalkanoate synthesis regulator phasin
MKRKCPFCNRMMADILKHIRIYHDIENLEKYNQEIENLEKYNAKREAFQKYVDELQGMEKKGSITAEDYRRLITEWIKQHKT